MASVGPQLPPSITEKRKRDDSDSEDSTHEPASKDRSDTPESASKRQRTIGPTLPPAPLDERPPQSPSHSSSPSDDDDDDFGPALPSATTSTPNTVQHVAGPQAPPRPTARDEWMTMAPESGDWSSRIDPTKLKNRKFNSGKGAKGPAPKTGGGGADASWHETPAEKQARLKREIMGIKDPPRGGVDVGSGSGRQDDVVAKRRSEKMREFTEKSRGPTLYAEHQKSNPREKEDDPSARAFDREKDIAGGMKIDTSQRKELMQKAGDFNSRFSSAKYL